MLVTCVFYIFIVKEKEATVYHKILRAVCHKILCIDSVALNVSEMLPALYRANSGRGKEWRSAEPGYVRDPTVQAMARNPLSVDSGFGLISSDLSGFLVLDRFFPAPV